MNINCIQRDDFIKPNLSCPSTKAFNSNCPLKLSSTSQILIVKNPIEQAELLNNLIWRQKTLMPVVKILSFKYDSCDFGYPKTYTIEVEPIEKSMCNLSNIQLAQSLYLIQQCLQGVQALTYKYSSFDFHHLFFGVNQRGQCRTWISNNFLEYKANQLPLPSQDIIICHIIKMIQTTCNIISKMELGQLIKQIVNLTNLNFTQMNVKLSQFAKLKKVLIPKKISLINRSTPFYQTKSDITQNYSSSKQHKHTPYKVNFRYQSPIKEKELQKQKINQQQKYSFVQTEKLHYSGNYQNIYNSVTISERNPSSDRKLHYGVRCPFQTKSYSVQKMLMSSQNLKNKLKMSKDSFKDSCKNSLMFGHQSKTDQKVKTCTSWTFPSEKLIQFSQSKIQNKKQYENQTKNSFSTTTHLSDKQNHYSINIKSPLQSLTYISSNQNYNNTQSIQKHIASANQYNFGGVLSLSQNSMDKSEQIDQIQLQLRQITGTNELLSIYQHKKEIIQSIVINNQSRQNISYTFDWEQKIVNLFSEDDRANLKTSVYCGEEKKPEPLPIKLNLLGKLGRQITSGSIIPQHHQF